jgi:hypothetical protein
VVQHVGVIDLSVARRLISRFNEKLQALDGRMGMAATFEFDPQLRLRHDPDITIRSLDDAAQVLNAHALAFADREAAQFHQRITRCERDTAANLANEFQQWARLKHLLSAEA